MSNGIKNILIRVPNWIGDAVLCEPAIRAVRYNFPHADITVLARPWAAPLFFNNPSVDRCVEYAHHNYHKGLSGKFRLIRRLKKEGYDLAILFQNAFDAAFLAFMAGIPERWGYSTDARGLLLTKSVEIRDKIKRSHQLFYYMNLLEEIGLNVDRTIKPKLYISDGEDKWAEGFLRENNLVFDKLIVGINPGASYGKAKMWLPERFAEVANRLIKEFEAQFLLFGSTGDAEICKGVAERIKQGARGKGQGARESLINLCGKTSLRELTALISRCSLFITNDSGPMHISASVGTPTAAIFGSTEPKLTSPIGDKVCVIKKDIECSPCFDRECRFGHYRCMEMVTADDVYNAVISNFKFQISNVIKSPAVFLDRDGTINEDTGYIDTPERLILIEGVSSAIKELNLKGFKTIVISNQSGVGRRYFSKDAADAVNKRLVEMLAEGGASVDGIYYCPHHPDDNCECRKPKTGLLKKAGDELNIDFKKSYVIGDKASDIELALNAGCKGVFVLTGHGKEHEKLLKSAPSYIAGDLKEAVEWIIKDRDA